MTEDGPQLAYSKASNHRALGGTTLAYLRSHGPAPFYLTIDAGQTPGCQDRHDNCGFKNNDFSYVSENELTVAAPG
jgi:hypothetical protein